MQHKLPRIADWKNNKYVKRIFVGILTYLCLLSINYVSESRGLADGFGKGIAPLLLAGFIAYLLLYFDRIQDRRLRRIAGVGGVLLSFSHVFGNYLHWKNDLFTTPAQTVLLLVVVGGVALFTVPLFALLMNGVQKGTEWWHSKAGQQEQRLVKFLFAKYWMGIFACYIPVFLCYWPVNFIYDAKYQLSEVVNNRYRIHHPILHTLLMGNCYKLGASLGSVSLGISFYALIQMLILSAAFAYTLRYLYLRGVPKFFRVAVFLISALFPMNSIFSITATKDVLFAAFFIFFMVLILQCCYHQEAITWQKALLLAVTGSLTIMFRKNAVYAVVIAVPFLVCAIRGMKRKVLLLILLIVTIWSADYIDGKVLIAVNATGDDHIIESMSVPMQQLARVAGYRREEIDEAIYQEMLQYWPAEFQTSYNPYLSDPIKNNINPEVLETNLKSFLKLWARVGYRFPGEYIESFLTNTMGFWYMGDTAHYMAVGDGLALFHTLIGSGEEIVKQNFFPPAGWLLDPVFFHVRYNQVPILGFLFRSSTYFWMMVIYFLIMVYRRDYGKIAVMAAAFLYYASCFFGPWVALRYIYAVVICWPLFVSMCFHETSKESAEEKK